MYTILLVGVKPKGYYTVHTHLMRNIMIGERLRRLIKKRGLKQVEVCRAVGLSPSRLSNYLSGSREPDLETLSKIARFLDVRLDYFAYGDSIKNTREVGEKIVKLREMLGLSKQDLAKSAGLEIEKLSRIELGYGEFERELVESISTALKCDSEYLIGPEYYGRTAGGMVAEPETVKYVPDEPSCSINVDDLSSGKITGDGSAFWICVNDGRFAPNVNQGNLMYINKITSHLVKDGTKVLYCSGGQVMLMKAFEYKDSILLAPETGDSEPIFIDKAKGLDSGNFCFEVQWIAVKA